MKCILKVTQTAERVHPNELRGQGEVTHTCIEREKERETERETDRQTETLTLKLTAIREQHY